MRDDRPELDGRTRRLVADVVEVVRAIPLEAPAVFPRLAPLLGELLDYEATCLYRPAPTTDGFTLKDLALAGSIDGVDVLAAYDIESDEGRAFAGYDPLRPSAAQRNRVLEPKRVLPRASIYPSVMARVQRRVGVHHLQELRVVVCDRRSALAWVGGYRAAPFEQRDTAILDAIAAALRPRLAVEAQLGLSTATASLDAALEATDAAMILVRDRDRTIAHANASGRAWLRRHERWEAVREALDGSREHRVTPLATGHTLVTLAPRSAASPRWRQLARSWGLSPRQTEVFARVVTGDGNEAIAAELGIGLRTVERHVAAIVRRARVATRAALVAKALHDTPG